LTDFDLGLKVDIEDQALGQACQTQTSLRAAKATKTAESAQKSLSGPHLTNFRG